MACDDCATLRTENDALRRQLDATIGDVLELLHRLDEYLDHTAPTS